MNENSRLIITVGGMLLSTLIGVLIPFISSLFDRKIRKEELHNEKLKNNLDKICNQYATFYKLEELYLDEIRELRLKNGIESKTEGIRNEFREEVYKTTSARIEFNESSILAEKDYLLKL